MTKNTYKARVNKLVKAAAFKYFLNEKEKHTKLDEVEYDKFVIQPYLTSTLFNSKERNLLYSLRSRCHPSKANFKKLFKSDLNCSFGCNSIEDQRHVFNRCVPVSASNQHTRYEYIFSDIHTQKSAISIFSEIDEKRNELIHNLLPGGERIARTRAH